MSIKKTTFKFTGTLGNIRNTLLNVYVTNPGELLCKVPKDGRVDEVVMDVVADFKERDIRG